ncbi:hypothetical protein DE4585_03310 [Mycobacteroides salmoniphilum]|uniref:Uncharacterized protein n=1 Tax=Mycobacteroides salmoniphilum TaxID=404941 RepID=A0A4R8S3J7_9MYCO|nr:hypothetical protein DE4585_03310 [Mycobacteroides salmoniphilum]
MFVKDSLKTVLFAATLALGSAPVTASAEPPGFPDLNNFTAVNAQDYVQAGRGGDYARFSPPSRQYSCSFLTKGVANPAPLLSCSGNIPGVPDNVPTVGPEAPCPMAIKQVNKRTGNYAFNIASTQCGDIEKYSSRVIPVGEKITFGAVTCAVTDDDSVACVDATNGNNGFLLSPVGSSTF